MSLYESIRGEFPVFQFDDFIFSEKNPFPDNRILDFLTVGPFVLHTAGSFEAEHMYEREKILLEDYLLPDGGEKSVAPVLGGRLRNKYYGDEYLHWKKGFIKWNCLRFDNEEDACDPALYATQQRNAVYYAAFYIDCNGEREAVICYENSGCALFVNGQQADFQPFGRVKGLWGLGHQCLVRLNKGLNLILFKLRPGYIADSMDISMSNCSVFPVIIKNDEISLTTPSVTAAYTGEKGSEKQVFPVFCRANCDISEYEIEYGGGVLSVPPMKKGEIVPLRFEIPANDTKTVSVTVRAGGRSAQYFFNTTPYDGFEGTEHIYSDFHFDTTYHQEQRTYALGAFHITKSIVERLISNPDFKATLSEIDYLHPYYSLYPRYRGVLEEGFSSGRAESDCFYNQPNDLTSSGEAFVRNLVYGQLYHRDVMGRLSTVYVPGDVFGHFSQMTQVCKRGGCDYIKWGKMMLGVDSLFRHVSPDGTSLLHDKGMGRATAKRLGVAGCDSSSQILSYMETYPREGNTDWMKNTASNACFSVFSDLARDVNESAEKMQKEGTDTEIMYSSRDVTQHHSGVLLTRTDFKQANRLCENLLVTAEKFCSIAFMHGMKYPDRLIDKAQRQLLCAQHHDSITGTNNEISFVDLMIEYRECASILCDVIEKACRFIAGGVSTQEREKCIFVFNPLTWERGGKCFFNVPKGFTPEGKTVLEDTKGNIYDAVIEGDTGYFIAKRLPAMGYSVYKIRSTEGEGRVVRGEDTLIENGRFRLEIDPSKGGTIVSLYDKKEKRELVDKAAPAPANTVYVMKEIHDRMETQHELYTTGHKLLSSEYEAQVASEKCELYQRLTVRVRLDVVATLIQEITLYKGSDTVDFRTVVEDYQSEDDLFTVTFPMDISGGGVVFDDRFAPHVSIRSKKYMSFQTHQYASFSGCRVLPANQWFGVGPTITVGAGKSTFNVGMTAIIRKNDRIQREIADRLLFALSKKAVPVTLYPDCEQHGGMKLIHFNEDVYSTDTRIVPCLADDGNLYKEKLLGMLSKKSLAKYERALERNRLAAVWLKDNDNIYKKNIDVLLVTGADESALDGFTRGVEAALMRGAVLELPDVITDLPGETADDYGCVLINNGTPASSVEGRATLNMMLFHTAAFYGNMGKVTGDREMVPERKTHIFTYALYPHKGSYREAGVYKRAQEFNDTLYSITDVSAGENTPLPEERGYLKSPDNFTVTAFKAAGYPYANFRGVPEKPSERGFTVRGFENTGLSAKVSLKTGFTLFGAAETDLLEENPVALKSSANSFELPVTAHSINTVKIKAPAGERISDYSIEETEPLESVYVRSWEHDMGSMPMGNLSFCATIERLPDSASDRKTLYINAVNNCRDRVQNTKISVVCSEGIRADRKEIDISLEGGKYEIIPLEIDLCGKKEGQVKIFWSLDEGSFFDVYEIGCFEPEISLKIEEKEIVCSLRNPTDEILTGEMHLAVPFEMWGNIIPRENGFGRLYKDSFFIELQGKQHREIRIPYEVKCDFIGAFWAAAKLAVNGRIYFAFDKKQGMRHNIWAHEFFGEIIKDNGSIKKILEM